VNAAVKTRQRFFDVRGRNIFTARPSYCDSQRPLLLPLLQPKTCGQRGTSASIVWTLAKDRD